MSKPAKTPTQRAVITITDTEAGDGRVDVDITFEPSVKKRTTNSNALNLTFRLKAIIEKHWQQLSEPLPHQQEEKSKIIVPADFPTNKSIIV